MNAINLHTWLTAILTPIEQGHKQSQIDDLLTWNHAPKVGPAQRLQKTSARRGLTYSVDLLLIRGVECRQPPVRAALKLLICNDKACCRGRIRTCRLQVMSHLLYQLS
jgi:hypothetical protein